MNSPRLWILILALVSFLTGVAAGLVGGEFVRRDAVPDRPLGDFERRFAEEFGLDEEERGLLADLVASYTLEIDRILEQQAALAHDQMEADLRVAGERHREVIRESFLVSEAERKRYDDLLEGRVTTFEDR